MPAPDPIPDLLKAVNEASGKAFALWITFLTVGIYLAIAIGTTTHLQLLLAGPVKLPLLGVDLPLFAFYGVAPPVFVVLHLYVLTQLYLLARLLRLFDDQLQTARMLEQDRRMIRGQLDKFVFTQFLIGAPQDAPQDALVRLFLWAVVWLSFVAGPVVLLVMFQLRFLPYHSIPVTIVHRVALLLDLMLLGIIWPGISRGALPHDRYARRRLVGAYLVAGVLVGFCAVVATVPGEGWLDLRGLGMVSRSLVLFGERLVEPDEDKLSKLSRTLSLSDRDLRGAAFYGSDFRKADLRGADLSGADLHKADLRSTDLTSANLNLANLVEANLGGAILTEATLRNASLGATFMGARAILSQANLGRADLSGADLSGADLQHANLSGANLYFANLSGADLSGADLRLVTLNPSAGHFRSVPTMISQQQLDAACGDAGTRLPDGMTITPCPKPSKVAP